MPSPSMHSGEDLADDQIIAEINITPLTDVFLVLLIIFMVTTSVISSQGKSVDLPEAAVADTTPSGVTVTVTERGEIEVDGRRRRGDVEIHLTPTDWGRHGHDGDAAFAGVILHVVIEFRVASGSQTRLKTTGFQIQYGTSLKV